MALQYEEPVRNIICEVLELESCANVSGKDDLQYIGMDSLNCMQLMIALEDTFGMEIPEEKLGLSSVRNIYDICKLVEEVNGGE